MARSNRACAASSRPAVDRPCHGLLARWNPYATIASNHTMACFGPCRDSDRAVTRFAPHRAVLHPVGGGGHAPFLDSVQTMP